MIFHHIDVCITHFQRKKMAIYQVSTEIKYDYNAKTER